MWEKHINTLQNCPETSLGPLEFPWFVSRSAWLLTIPRNSIVAIRRKMRHMHWTAQMGQSSRSSTSQPAQWIQTTTGILDCYGTQTFAPQFPVPNKGDCAVWPTRNTYSRTPAQEGHVEQEQVLQNHKEQLPLYSAQAAEHTNTHFSFRIYWRYSWSSGAQETIL